MKISKITEIPPIPARCIEVDSSDRIFTFSGKTSQIQSHNSVSQRNIILGCILRPDRWRFLGIDLKKVELSSWRKYSNVVLGVATTLEDALTVLRFAQQTMMRRYSEMEELNVNNFIDLPVRGEALMVMVDEMGELLSPSGVKALSENTFIPTPEGLKFLKDLEIGDQVFDSNSEITTIINKYEPEEQTRFEMTVSSESNDQEGFIAGSEHFWVAYFEYPDGRVEGPETVTTEYLYNYKLSQDLKPEYERIKVRFKKKF